MAFLWFEKVTEELQKRGIDRHQCGHAVLSRIRFMWLEDRQPEEVAEIIKAEFFA